MRDVLRSRSLHVTTSTVSLFRVMGGRKLRLIVARQALATKESCALRSIRRKVRIMATGAGHLVSADALAGALS